MGKKIALVAIVIGLIVGTIYFIAARPGGKSLGTLTSTTIAPDAAYPFAGFPKGEMSADSLVRTVNDRLIFVGTINPRNIDPLVTHFQKVRDRFATTELWKKLNLDQLIELGLQGLIAENSDSVPVPTNFPELLALVQREWDGVKELFVAMSSERIKLAGTEIPKGLVVIQFTDLAARQRLSQALESQFADGKSVIDEGPLKIERTSPDFYAITATTPDEESVDAAIEFSGAQAFATIGTRDRKSFLAASAGGPEGAKTFVDSPHWTEASTSLLPSPGGFMYFDFSQLMDLVKILGGSEEENQAIQEQMLQHLSGSGSLQGVESVAVSINFQNGVATRSCARVAPGSKAKEFYDQVFNDPARGQRKNIAPALLDAASIFALEASGHMIKAYVQSMASVSELPTADELKSNPNKYSPEERRNIENYFALAKLLSKNPVRQLSGVLDSPKPEDLSGLMGGMAGAPTPDFKLYIEFERPMPPADFAKLLNNLATLYAADLPEVELPIAAVQNTPGGDVVMITLGAENTVVAGSASETALVIGKDASAIERAKALLSKPATMITEDALKGRGLGGFIDWADMYWYLSTAPLVDLAKSFAPLALGMAPPQYQVTMNDVEQFLELLKVRLLSLQNSAPAAEDIYCSEARGVAL